MSLTCSFCQESVKGFLSWIRTFSCYLVKSDESRISFKNPIEITDGFACEGEQCKTTIHVGYCCKGNL